MKFHAADAQHWLKQINELKHELASPSRVESSYRRRTAPTAPPHRFTDVSSFRENSRRSSSARLAASRACIREWNTSAGAISCCALNPSPSMGACSLSSDRPLAQGGVARGAAIAEARLYRRALRCVCKFTASLMPRGKCSAHVHALPTRLS